ncbi:hypothetical protein [Laceyella tengchongensis]
MYYDDYDPYYSEADDEFVYADDDGYVKQFPPRSPFRVAPETLRMYVGQIVNVVIREVSVTPLRVYVADVNPYGDATLISCRGNAPQRMVVSARDVTIVG